MYYLLDSCFRFMFHDLRLQINCVWVTILYLGNILMSGYMTTGGRAVEYSSTPYSYITIFSYRIKGTKPPFNLNWNIP